jgi:hypothetical protein
MIACANGVNRQRLVVGKAEQVIDPPGEGNLSRNEIGVPFSQSRGPQRIGRADALWLSQP